MSKKGITEKPWIGQGRAGLQRRPEPDHISQPSDVTGRISGGSKIATGKTNSSQHTSGMHDRVTNNNHFHQMFYCTQIHFTNLYQSNKIQIMLTKLAKIPVSI